MLSNLANSYFYRSYMRKNKYLNISVILLIIIAGYFLTAAVFPKNLNRYPGFIVLLLIDLYLWSYVKNRIFTYNKIVRLITASLYWLPLAMISGLVVVAYFVPQSDWNNQLRIYLFGAVFVFYLAKIFTSIILLLSDFVKVISRLVGLITGKKKIADTSGKEDRISRGKFIENVAYLGGGLIIGTMFTGMFKWVHDFTLHKITLPLKGLTSGFDGFRIVQISDLHLGSWSNKSQLQKAVDLINEQQADLVVFTGDLVNNETSEAQEFKEILGQIEATQGVAAILGNHDYGDYLNWPTKQAKKRNFEDLLQFYRDLNWKLLRNENFVIELNGEKLGIIGVENWSANSRFPQLGNIPKAIKGMGKVDAKILLSHDPSHWSHQVIKQHKDIGLMLAGHTHGFQFGIEMPKLKWSPAQYVYQHWAGLYNNEISNQHLYVNRGIGSIGYPGRIGILPEITVINLQT
jgi:uncharacterized protein